MLMKARRRLVAGATARPSNAALSGWTWMLARTWLSGVAEAVSVPIPRTACRARSFQTFLLTLRLNRHPWSVVMVPA